jgi:hypothetical protein
MIAVFAFLALMSGGFSDLSFAETLATDQKIREMVEQLGADRFQDREAASRWLWESGLVVESYLLDAVMLEDPYSPSSSPRIS